MFPLILIYLVLTIIRPQEYIPAFVAIPGFARRPDPGLYVLVDLEWKNIQGAAVCDSSHLSAHLDDLGSGQRLDRRARWINSRNSARS